MAVRLVTAKQVFIGLSTDTKPSSPPEGSTYHVLDTGEEYIFYNDTWEQDLRRIYASRSV